jgi:hypothetical protein
MARRLLATIALSIGCAVTATTAFGDGGPEPGVMQGGGGIEQGGIRYVAVPAGGKTVLEVIRRSDANVLRFVCCGAVGASRSWRSTERPTVC